MISRYYILIFFLIKISNIRILDANIKQNINNKILIVSPTINATDSFNSIDSNINNTILNKVISNTPLNIT